MRAFVLQTGGCNTTTAPNAGWLSMAEREEISRGVAAGQSCRQLAARLERARSTVSRELAGNGDRHHDRARPPMPRPWVRSPAGHLLVTGFVLADLAT